MAIEIWLMQSPGLRYSWNLGTKNKVQTCLGSMCANGEERNAGIDAFQSLGDLLS